jgi:hypothetical protein
VRGVDPPFETSVFINCPFDDDFRPLFRALLFTVLRLGLNPRFALEKADSGETRVTKILGLIRQSQYGIHDLSRCVAKKKGEYYRMNMPLELGFDISAREFGNKKLRSKKILILEEDRYRFQKAISDLSNSDILGHEGEPEKIVKAVRDWLSHTAEIDGISGTQIWAQFNEFMADNAAELSAKKFSVEEIRNFPVPELERAMRRWLTRRSLR